MNEVDEAKCDALLSEAVSFMYPNLRLVTDWVLVVEASDETGRPNITAKRPLHCMEWKAKGMLWYALHELTTATDDDA